MTIKQAFEKLAATCSAGMKNPFFIMRNLHDAFADIAGKIVDGGDAKDVSYDNDDSGLTADDVQGAIDELASEKLDLAGGTMSGALTVEEDITGYRFKFVEPVLGGSINLYGRPSTAENNIEFPNKSGTIACTSDILSISGQRNLYSYNSATGTTYTITVEGTGCVADITLKHAGGGNIWHGIWLDSELIPIKVEGSVFTVTLVDNKTLTITSSTQYYRLGILANQPLTVSTS